MQPIDHIEIHFAGAHDDWLIRQSGLPCPSNRGLAVGENQKAAAPCPSAPNLVLGLAPLGGTRKRMLLSAFALYARANGSGYISDSRLQHVTELGDESFLQTMKELETEGWVLRDGEKFILALEKMKANQRYLVGLSDTHTRPNKVITRNTYKPGTSGTPNRFKKGSLCL